MRASRPAVTSFMALLTLLDERHIGRAKKLRLGAKSICILIAFYARDLPEKRAGMRRALSFSE